MLKERARAVAAGLRVLDLATIAAAFPIAYLVREALFGHRLAGLLPIGRYAPLAAIVVAAWVVTAWAAQVYGAYRTRSLGAEIGRLARALGSAGLAAAATLYAAKLDLSRALVLLHLAVALVLLAANRVVVRSVARAARRRGYNTRAFAVVGSGPLAAEVKDALLAAPGWGFTFAGTIRDGPARSVAGGPVLGQLDQLGTILERNVVDLVVFAVSRDRLEVVEEALRTCEEQGVAAKICLDLFPRRVARIAVEDVAGLPLLSFSSTPSDAIALVAKRAFDLVASAAALVLLAPVLLAIAAAVKLDSPGPVLFRQRRVGLAGRTFTLYKFRSMRQDAEAQRRALEARNEMDGPVFKIRDDPRVTRVGRFLRRTSLDELPQFWNVLRGEMSVVGPRPPIPAEVRRYARWQRRRLSVKPGLTCTWQVSGRNEVDFDRWMALDLDYIDTWSLWGDVRIVLKTIPAVLLGRGAR